MGGAQCACFWLATRLGADVDASAVIAQRRLEAQTMSDVSSVVKEELDYQLALAMREIVSERERVLQRRELWGERLVLLCLLPFYAGLSQPLGIVFAGALVLTSAAGILFGAWLIRSAALGRININSIRLKRTNARLKLVDSDRH